MRILRVVPEQRQNFLEIELRGRPLTLDGGIGKLALPFLQVQNARLDRVLDGHLVDHDVESLIQPVNSIDGLFLDELSQFQIR